MTLSDGTAQQAMHACPGPAGVKLGGVIRRWVLTPGHLRPTTQDVVGMLSSGGGKRAAEVDVGALTTRPAKAPAPQI